MSKIIDVRVFDRALTTDEIIKIAQEMCADKILSLLPVVYLPMNESECTMTRRNDSIPRTLIKDGLPVPNCSACVRECDFRDGDVVGDCGLFALERWTSAKAVVLYVADIHESMVRIRAVRAKCFRRSWIIDTNEDFEIEKINHVDATLHSKSRIAGEDLIDVLDRFMSMMREKSEALIAQAVQLETLAEQASTIYRKNLKK